MQQENERFTMSPERQKLVAIVEKAIEALKIQEAIDNDKESLRQLKMQISLGNSVTLLSSEKALLLKAGVSEDEITEFAQLNPYVTQVLDTDLRDPHYNSNDE